MEAKGMRAVRIISLACIGLALLMVVTTTSAQAQCCYYVNPLFLPFAAAGAVLGTAAAITTGLVAPPYAYPAYYGPRYYAPARVYYAPRPYPHGSRWVAGHYDRHGLWVPGHWRETVWVPGHYNRYGAWIPGHWG